MGKKKKKKDDDDDEDEEEDNAKGAPRKSADGEDDLVYTDEVITEAIARLRRTYTEKSSGNQVYGTEDFFDDVRLVQVQESFSMKLRMYVVLQVLFDEAMKPALVAKPAVI